MGLTEYITVWHGADLRSRPMELWSGNRSWPISTDQFVFLGNAVVAVGRNLFSDAWTGTEPWQAYLPTWDDVTTITQDGFDAVYAVSLLGRFRPDLGIGPELDFNLSERPLSGSEWSAAFDAFERHEAPVVQAARLRYATVARTIATLAASSQVVTYRRAVERSTGFTELPAECWSSEDAIRRFALFLINPVDPYSPNVLPLDIFKALPRGLFTPAELALAEPEYIFIGRSGLDDWLASTMPKNEAGEVFAKQHRRGRKPKYNWLTFEGEVRRVLGYEGGFSAALDPNWNQAALEEKMKFWCIREWGQEPGESTIRAKIAAIWASFSEGQKGQI